MGSLYHDLRINLRQGMFEKFPIVYAYMYTLDWHSVHTHFWTIGRLQPMLLMLWHLHIKGLDWLTESGNDFETPWFSCCEKRQNWKTLRHESSYVIPCIFIDERWCEVSCLPQMSIFSSYLYVIWNEEVK